MGAQLTVEGCPSGCRDREPYDTARLSEWTTAEREKLLLDNLASIYGLIYATVGNREEAEDLTSRVFVAAAQQPEPCTPEEVYSLLARLARAVVEEYWRAFYRAPYRAPYRGPYRAPYLVSVGPLTRDAETTQEAAAPMATPAQRVDRILGLLPPREREVLTHRFLLNRSAHETAELMLLSEAEVNALVYRALTMAADLDPGGL